MVLCIQVRILVYKVYGARICLPNRENEGNSKLINLSMVVVHCSDNAPNEFNHNPNMANLSKPI
jgi:hypothetical protein